MSAYLSRRGLEQLRSHLSERDLAVVKAVREHRFLTAHQIQELHFSDHTSGETGARVCRRVLARLAKERVLTRLRRRIGGVRAGSGSFIYAVGPIGGRLIDEHRRRVTEPSPLFLDHTLAVAETHVRLVQAARRGQLEVDRLEVEPACWRRYVGPNGAPEIVRPDLYVVTAGEGYEDCWFLEIDRGTESPAAIRRKCRAYELYWRTGSEQEEHGAFPVVVWVAPDLIRAGRIESVIHGDPKLTRNLFRVTAADGLVALLAGGAG